MKLLKGQSGFTLIELVLVIIVLGILAAVATVQFGNILRDSKDAAIQGVAGSTSAQLAVAINGLKGLPTVAAGTGACVTSGAANPTFNDRVYQCISTTGNVFKGPLAAAFDSFAICTGANTCTTAGASCGSTSERYMTVTYAAATGALTFSAIANCTS